TTARGKGGAMYMRPFFALSATIGAKPDEDRIRDNSSRSCASLATINTRSRRAPTTDNPREKFVGFDRALLQGASKLNLYRGLHIRPRRSYRWSSPLPAHA